LNLSDKTKGYPKSQSHRRETVCGFAYVDSKINDKGESISKWKWVRL